MDIIQLMSYETVYTKRDLLEQVRQVRSEYLNNPPERGERAIDVMVPAISAKHPVRVYFDEWDVKHTDLDDLKIHHILAISCCGCSYDDDVISDHGKQKVLNAVIQSIHDQQERIMEARAA